MNTQSWISRSFLVALLTTLAILPSKLSYSQTSGAAAGGDRSVTLLADVQEANAKTGILTATGNVQIFYPRKGITATALQAQYFSREHRMVLTGNVVINQVGGNSIRGEKVTYLLDEERFIVAPKDHEQVRSVYVVPEDQNQSSPSQSLPNLPSPSPSPTDSLIDHLPQ